MMLKIFFLLHVVVAVGLAGPGVLATPVQRTQALNVYGDTDVEIRRSRDSGSAATNLNEGTARGPRNTGHYVRATGCPLSDCSYMIPPGGFTPPGRHLIPFHSDRILGDWNELDTLVKRTYRRRIFPRGEDAKTTARVVTDHPQAAPHLEDRRNALGLFAGHMSVQQAAPHAAGVAAEQTAQRLVAAPSGPSTQQATPEIERRKLQMRARFQRVKAAAQRFVDDPATGSADRFSQQAAAEMERRRVGDRARRRIKATARLVAAQRLVADPAGPSTQQTTPAIERHRAQMRARFQLVKTAAQRFVADPASADRFSQQAAAEMDRRRARDRARRRIKATARLVADPGGPSTEQAAPSAIQQLEALQAPNSYLAAQSSVAPPVVGHSDHGGLYMPI